MVSIYRKLQIKNKYFQYFHFVKTLFEVSRTVTVITIIESSRFNFGFKIVFQELELLQK